MDNFCLLEHGFFDDPGFIAYTWKYKNTEPKMLFTSFGKAENYIKTNYPDYQADLEWNETGSKLFILYEGTRIAQGFLLTPLKVKD